MSGERADEAPAARRRSASCRSRPGPDERRAELSACSAGEPVQALLDVDADQAPPARGFRRWARWSNQLPPPRRGGALQRANGLEGPKVSKPTAGQGWYGHHRRAMLRGLRDRGRYPSPSRSGTRKYSAATAEERSWTRSKIGDRDIEMAQAYEERGRDGRRIAGVGTRARSCATTKLWREEVRAVRDSAQESLEALQAELYLDLAAALAQRRGARLRRPAAPLAARGGGRSSTSALQLPRRTLRDALEMALFTDQVEFDCSSARTSRRADRARLHGHRDFLLARGRRRRTRRLRERSARVMEDRGPGRAAPAADKPMFWNHPQGLEPMSGESRTSSLFDQLERGAAQDRRAAEGRACDRLVRVRPGNVRPASVSRGDEEVDFEERAQLGDVGRSMMLRTCSGGTVARLRARVRRRPLPGVARAVEAATVEVDGQRRRPAGIDAAAASDPVGRWSGSPAVRSRARKLCSSLSLTMRRSPAQDRPASVPGAGWSAARGRFSTCAGRRSYRTPASWQARDGVAVS